VFVPFAQAHFALDNALPNRKEIADFLSLLASKKPQDDNAERVYGWALDLDPYDARALNGLGRIHLLRSEWGKAAECFRRAAAADPNPVYLVNGANALTRAGEPGRSLDLCRQALELDPEFLPAFIQKTAIEQLMGFDKEARETIEAGLSIDPECPELRFARYEVELMHGDIENALRDYEYRPSRLELAEKLDELPEWQGEDLTGKTILVCLEQGLGDQIQHVRYLLSAQFEGANVVLFTHPELARLFAPLVPSGRVITSHDEADPIHFDYWIGLCSLRYRCEEVGARTPYITAPAESIEYFRSVIPDNGRLRVGLCWAGNPRHARDRERSLAFVKLAPLLDIEGVDFYSLQAGEPATQAGDGLSRLTFRAHDLADTAAAIANLDLVITVDTALLHLAGAMGKRVWGMMRASGDPRWGVHGMDTPIYPSAQLFRQSIQGDWTGVIERIRLALIDAAKLGALLSGLNPASVLAPPPRLLTASGRYGWIRFHRNDHYVGRSLRLYGEYSESEAELLRGVLAPADTVIEAGANIGALTVAIADAVGPEGAVYAFEPQRNYFGLLEWNTYRHKNVSAYHQALGADARSVEINDIELEHIHAPGWNGPGPPLTVGQRNIDSLDVDPALIKIDVDGQELEILEGADQTIRRTRPFLYVENDKPEAYPNLIPWIEAHGYRIYQHYAPLYNPSNFLGCQVNVFGKTVSAMLLCIPRERFMPEDFVRRFRLQRVRVRKEQ